MSLTIQELGIDRLSVLERLNLIQEIWDSLPNNVLPDEVPEWHKEIVTQRLAEAEANPGTALPWRDVLAAIRSNQP